MAIIRERAEIVRQEELTPGMWSLILRTGIALDAKPGQFVTLYPDDSSRLLPRPFGVCEAFPDKGELRLVYRIAGEGTREFSGKKPGEEITVMGPLGNGYPLLPGRAFLIGGGSGIPPMVELAKKLSGTFPGRPAAVLGYRDSQMFLREDLEKYADVYIATEDGSFGTRGNVLDAIRERNLAPGLIYACGPMPMLRALKQYAKAAEIPLYVSLEEKMACGIGACLACVCRTAETDSHSNVKNKRICKDGPVFPAAEVEL